MEQSFKQSEAFREQVDEASKKVMGAWGYPVHPGQDELVKVIRQLQDQVGTLADKVESLEQQLQTK
jgi:TolA-binding protein